MKKLLKVASASHCPATLPVRGVSAGSSQVFRDVKRGWTSEIQVLSTREASDGVGQLVLLNAMRRNASGMPNPCNPRHLDSIEEHLKAGKQCKVDMGCRIHFLHLFTHSTGSRRHRI